MPLPERYRKSGEGGVISYSYVDIITGIGVVQLYAHTSDTGSSTFNYGLSPTAYEVGDINNSTFGNTAAKWTKLINDSATNVTFSLSTMNQARRLRGTAYLSFTVRGKADPSHAASLYVTAELYKNTTLLATASNSAKALSTNSTYVQTYLIPFTLSETVIAAGDVIKLKLTGVTGGATPTGHYLDIIHDPLNRDLVAVSPLPGVTASDNPTQMLLSLPFVIDL